MQTPKWLYKWHDDVGAELTEAKIRTFLRSILFGDHKSTTSVD